MKLLFCFLGFVLVSAHAQQFQGVAPTIDELKISKVLVGKPGLEADFKGRVVVLICLSHSALFPRQPSFALNDLQKAAWEESERKSKTQREKNLKEAKTLAKDFAALERKFGENPEFRLAGLMSGFLDDPNTVVKAQQVVSAVNFSQAIVHQGGDFKNGLSHGEIYVFDRRGVLRYNGKPDSKLDDAIRKALRAGQ